MVRFQIPTVALKKGFPCCNFHFNFAGEQAAPDIDHQVHKFYFQKLPTTLSNKLSRGEIWVASFKPPANGASSGGATTLRSQSKVTLMSQPFKKGWVGVQKGIFMRGKMEIYYNFTPSWLHLVPASVHALTQLKGKRKESKMSNKKREGSTQGEGGLYKNPQIPTLPPKSQRSGVTFHSIILICSTSNNFYISQTCTKLLLHYVYSFIVCLLGSQYTSILSTVQNSVLVNACRSAWRGMKVHLQIGGEL